MAARRSPEQPERRRPWRGTRSTTSIRWRGPTASQAAGLTLAAARAIIDAVQASRARAWRGDELRGGRFGRSARRVRADGCAPIWSGSRSPATRRSPRWSTGCRRGTSRRSSSPGTEFYGYASVAGGRTIVFAGGMPLERNGVLVGAVGVSGGDAAQDQLAADARHGRSLRGLPARRAPARRRPATLAATLATRARGSGRPGVGSARQRAALSVRSHGRSRSGRPKWPYAAVWR